MSRRDDLDQKVITDCFELLHMVEMGRSSMQELSEIFGTDGNKAESNYRQVERIKHRCIRAGIFLEFDPNTMRFRTEPNAKLKFLDRMLPRAKAAARIREAFGYSVEKICSAFAFAGSFDD